MRRYSESGGGWRIKEDCSSRKAKGDKGRSPSKCPGLGRPYRQYLRSMKIKNNFDDRMGSVDEESTAV